MCLVWCSWLGCWFGCFVGFGDLWLMLRFMVLLLVRWMCVVLQLLWFRWLLSEVFVCLLSWSRLLLAWATWVGGCVCCLVLLIVLVFRIWFGCLGGWVGCCVVLVNCCSIAWYADYCAVCLLCRWLLGDLFLDLVWLTDVCCCYLFSVICGFIVWGWFGVLYWLLGCGF